MSTKRPSESHTEIENAEPTKTAPKGDVSLDIDSDVEDITDNPPAKNYLTGGENSDDNAESVNEDIPVSLNNTDVGCF